MGRSVALGLPPRGVVAYYLLLRFGGIRRHRGLNRRRSRRLGGGAELLRRLYEALRIRHEFLIHIRMRRQVLLKFRMIFQVLLVLRQGGILGEALRNLRMAAEEFTKVRSLAVIAVASPAAFTIVVMGITGFLLHEGVWILLQLLANFGMVLQVSLQGRMVLYELLVIHQRRVFAKLLGRFAVSVQELIEARQFLAIDAIAIIVT